MTTNTEIIKNKSVVDGQVFFTYHDTKYSVHKHADSMLHRESDNLESVFYDSQAGFHMIVTMSDFGGLGKDARKPCTIPFSLWLDKYCAVQ